MNRTRYITTLSTTDRQKWDSMAPQQNMRYNVNQPIKENDFPSLNLMIDYVAVKLQTVASIEYLEQYVDIAINNVQGANRVIGETPVGVINGSNAMFATVFPFEPDSLEIMVNGITLTKTEEYYTVGNSTIYLANSPIVGDKLLVNYTKQSTNI